MTQQTCGQKIAGAVIAIPYIIGLLLMIPIIIIFSPLILWDALVRYHETGKWEWL